MILDLVELATQAGYPTTQVNILAERPGRVVARLKGVDGSAVLKADVNAGAFGPEVAAIERLAPAGIPVPRVLAHLPGEPAVLILSWTEGQALTIASPLAVRRDVGRILRRVHRLQTSGPFSGQPDIDTWIANWLGKVVNWWPSNGGTPEEVERLRRWHQTLRPVLSNRTGELMLFDCRPEHFLVDAGGTVRLIDLHDLGPGDAAMDLAAIYLHDPSLTESVLDGYQPTEQDRETFDRLIPFFTVIRGLAAAEWNQRHGQETNVSDLLRRASLELASADIRLH
jgi:aminoglycoside phosphotransferase (APT) family kinase protein